MTLDEMRPEDWPVVARIYEHGLDLGTFEDTVPSWEQWDASHLPSPRLVARVDDEVAAWAALRLVSPRLCYRGVAENSVYVAPASRGHGIGRALLTELVQRSEEAGIWTIQAATFSDNHASIAMHEACGFRLVGNRERIARKHGVWRDTVLLERRSPAID